MNQLYIYIRPHISSLLHLPPSHPPYPTPLGSHNVFLKWSFKRKTGRNKRTTHKSIKLRASLVAQWLRMCLPMQGTRVRAQVWEDPTCRGAAGPMSHNCWACASGACALQQERPVHHDEEWPLLSAIRKSPRTEMKTQHSQK